MLERLLCLYTQKSKLLTVVSCAKNDRGDGVSSLALDPFLSLQPVAECFVSGYAGVKIKVA